ncbi:MAG: hypothetical protein A2452_07425 [Candidatus Firestonebacteria bacterium RIFOXYC2_FULL_39_67]|nr:MAG: hypothetical protein A2452_07425 [Candidatus Firestonebacteria bacterium RIFOXYC2_FULL_39_67]
MHSIEKVIHEGATPDQIIAIDHIGSHARLLAGPGTGKTKTLTYRVLSLILKHNQHPEGILLLTFTRLAAGQLRREIQKALEPFDKTSPQIATLHSFALQQILFNSGLVDTLPRPIRIADDWEERHIIEEDIKRYLKLGKIEEVKRLINQLSTDWETLRIEEQGWEKQFPNPQFLGAWSQHREIYGETLRAELVYQLKKQMSQNRAFKMKGDYKHVLVDEYQDLNACDLSVIKEISNKGAEVFVAGDDDQSIYGFRYALPDGIKLFPQIYTGASKLSLEICFRCDKEIFSSAEFVAGLDFSRLPKPTRPRVDAEKGEVRLLNYSDQDKEAEGVAKIIKNVLAEGTPIGRIAILLRNDRHGKISEPLIKSLAKEEIKVSLSEETKIDCLTEYRVVLSVLRLIVTEKEDSLAWRTLLQVSKAGIGPECFTMIEKLSITNNVRFCSSLMMIKDNPNLVPKLGKRIKDALDKIITDIDKCPKKDDLKEMISDIANCFISDVNMKEVITAYLFRIIEEQGLSNLKDLLREVTMSSSLIEQETDTNAVNILTMHQAKGLTFDVCFIVGAEDEYIPGKNQGEKEGDERRLLYVSMTRAKHKLYMTYCSNRTGQQRYSGRNSGDPKRTLTRFLRNSKIEIVKS